MNLNRQQLTGGTCVQSSCGGTNPTSGVVLVVDGLAVDVLEA